MLNFALLVTTNSKVRIKITSLLHESFSPSGKWQGFSSSLWAKKCNVDLIWRNLLWLNLLPVSSPFSTTLHIWTDKIHSFLWLAYCILKMEPNRSQITSRYLFTIKFIIKCIYTTKDMWYRPVLSILLVLFVFEKYLNMIFLYELLPSYFRKQIL